MPLRAPALVLALAAALTLQPLVAPAQQAREPLRVRLIYTGRSLGALGVLRDPDEHELLIETARAAGLPVRMGQLMGWRAAHASLFSPDGDLEAADLARLLANPSLFGPPISRLALTTNNAVLLQLDEGPKRLVAMAAGNARAAVDFPDLTESLVTVRQARLPGGKAVSMVLESSAPWAVDPLAWSEAEINAIEAGPDVLFEIAVNLGQMGPRATALANAQRLAAERGARTVVIDLGERDGDLGLERLDRARLDYDTLALQGYQVVVPYEFDLALGPSDLGTLQAERPGLVFLASNVTATSAPALFQARRMIEIEGVRIGLIGLVDPELRGVLAAGARRDLVFESPIAAAAREIAELRKAGADAVIALSNLHPRDNGLLAREVAGLDAIVADLHVRWSPEDIETQVTLPDRPRSRPGSPALVARSFANGLGLGTLELEFRDGPGGRRYLAALSHRLESITDRLPTDVALVRQIRARGAAAERPRGPVMVPALSDLVAVRPSLGTFDATAAEGRISKRMWEEFLARLLRVEATAEVGIIRKLPNFPPTVGALREADVRAWLWTEDDLVTLDLSGADLKAIMAEDSTSDLVVVGLDRRRGTVNGRRIQDVTLYRVATTDQLVDGARFRAFERARRVARRFQVDRRGGIHAAGGGDPLPIKAYVIEQLARLKAQSTTWPAPLAHLLDRDATYEPLFTFSFDRPTVFASFNRTVNTEGYGSVPESRIQASDSQVIGVSGRYLLGYERERVAWEFGTLAAYARNRVNSQPRGSYVNSETADDLQVDVTLRARRGDNGGRPRPFTRVAFDTEFTPSIDPGTGDPNRHQRLARASAGLSRISPRWPLVELAAAMQTDLTRGSYQYGVEGTVQFQRRLSRASQVRFRWDNAFSYYFPSITDNDTDLGVRLRSLAELQIPLVDALSLSIAGDVFVFRGKVPATDKAGASALLRVGLSYDRLWKPRYQPFF